MDTLPVRDIKSRVIPASDAVRTVKKDVKKTLLSPLLTDRKENVYAIFEKCCMLLLQSLGLKDCQGSHCIYTLGK